MLDIKRASDSDLTLPDVVQLSSSPTELYPALPHPQLRTVFKSMHSFATVLVGQDAIKFSIHKELLTSASPFFAAALNGAFSEGLDQVVTLPEEKPEIFEWFVWWLYTGSLTSPSSNTCDTCNPKASPSTSPLAPPPYHSTNHAPHLGASRPPTPQTHQDGDLLNAAGSPKYFLLLDLYSLSDHLLTTPLSNHIIDTLARLSERTNSVPTPSDTRILYETIRSPSPMRTLILDLFAYKKTDKLLASHPHAWHAKFLRDLVVKLKRPAAENLSRHELRAYRPAGWSNVAVCEGCRDVVGPGARAHRCEGCERVFCGACVARGAVALVGGEQGPCKPWVGRGLCARYHEHKGEGEGRCGEAHGGASG